MIVKIGNINMIKHIIGTGPFIHLTIFKGDIIMNGSKAITLIMLASVLFCIQSSIAELASIHESPANNPASKVASFSSRQLLDTYLKQLDTLEGMCQKAALEAYRGDIDQALDIMKQPMPVPESSMWAKEIQKLCGKLNLISSRSKRNTRSNYVAQALIYLQSPQLAIEYLENIQQEKGKLKFTDSLYLSQALLETGHYSRATEILKSLINKDTAADWKIHIEGRIKAISGLEDHSDLSIEACNAFFVNHRIKWQKDRFGPILIAGKTSGDEQEKLKLLKSVFDIAGDTYGQELILGIWYDQAVAEKNDIQAGDTLLRMAGIASKEKRYDIWRQIQTDYPGTTAWVDAVYSEGNALQNDKQYDKAIDVFNELITTNLNIEELNPRKMARYSDYQSRAQTQVSKCYFAKSDYDNALKSYCIAKKKDPMQPWCGRWHSHIGRSDALYIAICLEYLGRYDDAIKTYLSTLTIPMGTSPVICGRIVDMYRSGNEMDTLVMLLDEIDKYMMEKLIEEHGKKVLDDPDVKETLSKRGFTWPIRRIIEIRKPKTEQEISALVEYVVKESHGFYIGRDGVSNNKWQEIETAKALAKYPDKAVSLLKDKLAGTNRDKLIYYVLALCNTDQAIALLNEANKTATNSWQRSALEYAIMISDEGEKPIAAMKDIYFPPLPKQINFPTRMAQFDEDVAFLESIPKTMELDLSKPQRTIESYFTAALLGKQDLYEKCITNAPKVSRAYRAISESSIREKLTYEQSPPVLVEDDKAEVSVLITSERHSPETIVFVLVNTENQWRITGFKKKSRK